MGAPFAILLQSFAIMQHLVSGILLSLQIELITKKRNDYEETVFRKHLIACHHSLDNDSLQQQ
jgi:hypothetical protein